jgi:hypothetical protein
MTDAPWSGDHQDDAGVGPGFPEPLPPEVRKRKARWLFARVVIVQVVALIALWLLQSAYGS